ncbi:MAG: putative quinol monooxygenase [Cellvibrionaceae bacterium]
MSVNSMLLATTKQGKCTQLIEILNELLPETRQFFGCIDMKILRSHENPSEFIFFGEWESAENYQKYLKHRAQQGVLDKIGELLTAPPEIKIINNTDL